MNNRVEKNRPHQMIERPHRRAGSMARSLAQDLKDLFDKHGRERARPGGGLCGKKTLADRKKVMRRMLVRLSQLGYKLQRLDNLGLKHVRVLLEDIRTRGASTATASVYISHCRRLCVWLGKPSLVDAINDYVAEHPELVYRQYATTVDKSFDRHDVDVRTVIQQALELGGEWFGCQLALMWSLGLRTSEAWGFRPHLAMCPEGYRIRYNTKGGLARTIPAALVNDQQRAVIEWAQRLVRTRSGRMIPRGFNQKEWARKFYDYTNKLGLTKQKLGVTAYGLRHQRANDMYEWLTGVASPVRGGNLVNVDPQADADARQIIASAYGHSRHTIAGAYIGGMRRARGPRAALAPSAGSEGVSLGSGSEGIDLRDSLLSNPPSDSNGH